jgi:hypothetical protein
MDQILSNFVPYSNPYIVISWPVPTEFGLPSEQEIRSEVLWDGSIAMNYPTDLNGNEKARVIADTSFTIKGWLFKETTNPVGNIYYIKNNFFVESFLTSYQDMSGDTYSYPLSTGVYNENETVTVSATPTVTNMFYNGVLVDNNIPLVPGLTGNIILEGYNFDLLDGVLLSSNNSTIYQSVTSIKILGTQNTTISGQLLEFSVINKNILTFYVPALYPAFRSPNALVVFVPFNKAGFATTIDTYESF